MRRNAAVVLLASIGVATTAATAAAQTQVGSTNAAAQQCMAEIKQQIQTSIQPYLTGPPDRLAQAYSDALDKAPSVGECVAHRSRRRTGGGGSDDTVPQQTTLQNNGPQGPLADAAGDANAAIKGGANDFGATFASLPEPTPAPSPRKKLAIVAGAAGAVAVGLAVAKGGGSTPATTPAVTPTPTPTPVPTPTPTGITGTFVGKATLQTDPLTCKGSDAEYNEKATININASGSGTITLSDTPGFDRPYNVTNLTPSGFSTQGTFSFLGKAVPGTLSGSFNSGGTQATLIEQTNWGNCFNRYQSVLSKQ